MINYKLISKAIKKYQKLGYQYIEVPWIVPLEPINVTLPKDHNPHKVIVNDSTQGYLVGSAEQSFIDMMLNKKIKPGKYVAASPCFRDDEEDVLHKKYFFKVELIDIIDTNNYFNSIPLKDRQNFANQKLLLMMNNVLNIFNSLSKNDLSFDIQNIKTFPTYESDILYKGIEVGSYGVRTFENFMWVYGTGLAEPRFSYCLSRSRE